MEVGDIVLVSDEPIHILQNDEYAEIGIIHHIHQNYCDAFYISETCCKHFAKLICPKKHAEVYEAFKRGSKVVRRVTGNFCQLWILDGNPSWSENEEYRVVEPVHGTEENLETKYVFAWSFKENKWVQVEKDNTERMTNRELAMWLAKGNGEVKSPYYLPERIRCHFDYHGYAEKEIVASDILIRTWDEEEWHEPIKVKEEN